VILAGSHQDVHACSTIRQQHHTSAYVSTLSIRSAYAQHSLSIRLNIRSAYISIRQHTSAYVQHTSAYAQHTSAYVSIQRLEGVYAGGPDEREEREKCTLAAALALLGFTSKASS
jgi:hypothetical protein